jgi:hypothetical protein
MISKVRGRGEMRGRGEFRGHGEMRGRGGFNSYLQEDLRLAQEDTICEESYVKPQRKISY